MPNQNDELEHVDDLAAGLAAITSQLGQQTPAEPLRPAAVVGDDGAVLDVDGRTILPPRKDRPGTLVK